MIPIQDVVPSGKAPLATMALIAANTLVFIYQLTTPGPAPSVLMPFVHLSGMHFLANVLFLWLFGDNVEARAGRAMFVVIYLLSGVVAPWLISMVAPTTEPVMGAGVAVTGILGSYFLLLPRSLVLVLVPLPSWLSEVPALFFLGAWWLLHLVSLVLTDTAPHSSYAAVGTLVVAFVMGAGLGRVARRSVIW